MKTKLLSVIAAASIAVTSFAALTITASAEAYSFSYAYDCQRSPSFPSKGETCTASGFTYPLISWREPGNTNSGSWTLTYIGDYKDNSSVSAQMSLIAPKVQSSYNLATTDNIPVYQLKDGNTHIAYGVLCAISENNEEALFIGDTWPNGAGYVLSNVELSGSKAFTITKDITDIEYEHEVAAEVSVEYAQVGADYDPQFVGDTYASLWQVTVEPGHEAIESVGIKVTEKESGKAGTVTGEIHVESGTIVFGVVVNGRRAEIGTIEAVVNGVEVSPFTVD